jgi:hypothetical protein
MQYATPPAKKLKTKLMLRRLIRAIVVVGHKGLRGTVGNKKALSTIPDMAIHLLLNIERTSLSFHEIILSLGQAINMNIDGVKFSSILENQIVLVASKKGKKPMTTCDQIMLEDAPLFFDTNKWMPSNTLETINQKIGYGSLQSLAIFSWYGVTI